jgi:hypothetical protein
MKKQKMKIPPISVHTKNLLGVKECIHHYLGMDCIRTVLMDEQMAYVTFVDVEKTHSVMEFINKLSSDIKIMYNNQLYVITAQYLDI